jgi:hypothetical protein
MDVPLKVNSTWQQFIRERRKGEKNDSKIMLSFGM